MHLGKAIIPEYLRRSLYMRVEPSPEHKVRVLIDFGEGFVPKKRGFMKRRHLPVPPRAVLGLLTDALALPPANGPVVSFLPRATTAISAMTLNYQRNGNCASSTSPATAPGLKTALTCTISFRFLTVFVKPGLNRARLLCVDA